MVEEGVHLSPVFLEEEEADPRARHEEDRRPVGRWVREPLMTLCCPRQCCDLREEGEEGVLWTRGTKKQKARV